jgi:hypothetical protein
LIFNSRDNWLDTHRNQRQLDYRNEQGFYVPISEKSGGPGRAQKFLGGMPAA